jgi:hypothetical protein
MDEVERAQVQSSRRGLETRAAHNPLAGFIPWIIFWVVASSPSTWEYGAIGAALAAVILALPSVSRRRPKILDIATIVFFVAVAVIGAVVGAEDRDWLDRWSMVLSSGALGLIALGSLAFVPFTEQYAREQARRNCGLWRVDLHPESPRPLPEPRLRLATAPIKPSTLVRNRLLGAGSSPAAFGTSLAQESDLQRCVSRVSAEGESW